MQQKKDVLIYEKKDKKNKRGLYQKKDKSKSEQRQMRVVRQIAKANTRNNNIKECVGGVSLTGLPQG